VCQLHCNLLFVRQLCSFSLGDRCSHRAMFVRDFRGAGASSCLRCSPGRSSAGPTSGSCTDCIIGRYSNPTTSWVCTDCPNGQYAYEPISLVLELPLQTAVVFNPLQIRWFIKLPRLQSRVHHHIPICHMHSLSRGDVLVLAYKLRMQRLQQHNFRVSDPVSLQRDRMLC